MRARSLDGCEALVMFLANVNCVECFMRDGEPSRHADFIVNGQSVCQSHVKDTIRTRGEAAPTYTWHNDLEGPALLSDAGELLDRLRTGRRRGCGCHE